MIDRKEQTKGNRIIFLSIVGIPVTIVLVATWLWYFVAKGDLDLVAILGTVNHGTLIQPPRLLDDGNLEQRDGAVMAYAELAPQWTFLIPGGASCDTECEQLLYLTRQIHQSMGKEINRIRRFYVSDTQVTHTRFEVAELSDQRPTPDTFSDYLASEQRGLKAFTVSAESRATLFSEYAHNPSTWYLVDPAGWIMMSYNRAVPYKDVIADLKFLLKNSSE